jgi:hypothetical protein
MEKQSSCQREKRRSGADALPRFRPLAMKFLEVPSKDGNPLEAASGAVRTKTARIWPVGYCACSASAFDV